MGVRATLAVLLLFIATVEAGDGGVTFWREKFKMTCPGKGKWFKKTEEITNATEYEVKYDGKSKGLYRCEYKSETADPAEPAKKYYFYVKGKVCANCFELDASLFGLVIVGDVLGTAFIMMIIYKCIKKKSSPAPAKTPKAPARSGGLAPPVPSPDYDELSPHTRSQDPYSVVNRMG